jgi:hypothetical protein
MTREKVNISSLPKRPYALIYQWPYRVIKRSIANEKEFDYFIAC